MDVEEYNSIQDDLELDDLIEGRERELEEEEDGDQGGEREDEAVEAPAPKKKDKPAEDGEKKKRVIAPRPKLDPIRLTGPRGLLALEAETKNLKLRGRGHELDDIENVLSHLQHWAHRLFPRYTFDDCLEKLEKLGSKKTVRVQIKRVRMGLSSAEDEHDTTVRGDDYKPDDDNAAEDPEAAFNELLANIPCPVPIPAPPQPQADSNTGLSDEQRERILRNRFAAEERRLARLKEQQEMEKRIAEEEEIARSLMDSEEI